MKLRSVVYLTVVSATLSSCGVSSTDNDKVLADNEAIKLEVSKLKSELDECENGAEKLVAKVLKSYSDKDYETAKSHINTLATKHPESPKNSEFKVLLKTIDKEVLALQKLKEAEEKERVRLANIDNTGMWDVSFYVDDFGEPTKEGYIRNKEHITGYFSNTATQNSSLNVKLLITSSSDISIMLYEYSNNNPVKAYSPNVYRILIQDSDGKRFKLGAINYSDRLSFGKANSLKVHKILMRGGSIKFKIIESDTPTTNYEFTITKADWYGNAYTKLTK